MPLLSRLQQICIAEEATEATEVAIATLFSSALGADTINPEFNASYLAIDPVMDFEVETYERKIKQSTLTPPQPLVGAKLGKVSFKLEATARSLPTGANAGRIEAYAPSFDRPLRACGMRRERVRAVPIGAISTSTFRHGEIVRQYSDNTYATPTGTYGTVMGDTYDGIDKLYVATEHGLGAEVTMGTGSVEGWKGDTSGARAVQSASPSTLNTGALVWFPWSYPLTQLLFDATGLTAALAVGDVVRGTTSKAIGIVFYAAATAANTLVYIRRVSGHFSTGETMERVTPNADADIGVLAASGFEKQLAVPTVSIGMGKDGVREALYGCRGSWKLSGNIGEPAIFEFDMRGAKHSGAPVDGSNVQGVTFFDRTPPVLLGADMKIGKTGLTYGNEISPCINSFLLDAGVQAELRRCMSSATGVEEVLLVARKMTGNFDPELAPEVLFDYLGQFLANGIERLRFQIGSTDPDRFSLRLHNMGFTGITTGDRNGIATRQINFGLHSGSQGTSSGDNEMVIIWEPS